MAALPLLWETSTQTFKKKDTTNYRAFVNLCRSASLTQLIQSPTRVTSSSATIIDLILVTDQERIVNSGVAKSSISDHDIIFLTRKIKKPVIGCHNSIRLRSLKHYNKDALINSLINNHNLSKVFDCQDVDEALDVFNSAFLLSLDMVAPIKKVRIKQRTEKWINDDILEAIKLRNASFLDFKHKKDQNSFSEYKKQRNEVIRMVTKAKQNYFSEKIMEHKKEPKKLWKCLKETGYSTKTKPGDYTISLEVDGQITSEKMKVADHLNTHFSSVAQQLVSRLPPPSGVYGEKHLIDFYGQMGIDPGSFTFSRVSEATVCKQLSDLHPAKGTGPDLISPKFLKDAAEVITPHITHILNLSIESGTVPLEFKKARVVPLFKKGCKRDPNNYRPVSILCSLSKVLEKIVLDQINEFVTKNDIIYELQSGFRKSHSTETCLMYLTDLIRNEVDTGKFCGMVLLDLQKAFDTVDHSILIIKLKAMGFGEVALRWIRSYLSNRVQMVDINGTLSGVKEMRWGVPQGSILGPLLFLLYVNDFKAAISPTCNLFLYADDSALLASHQNKSVVENSLSTELKNVCDWLSDNRLSLHLGKTEAILFGSKAKLAKSTCLSIKINQVLITAKDKINYLGCILDNCLTGEHMARKALAKINQRIKFLARKAAFLDSPVLHTLAGALIQSHFDYAAICWYTGLSQKLKNKLQTAQNKLIRVILKVHPRTHLDQFHFNKLNWLSVKKRTVYIKLLLTFKIVKKTVPKYLNNFFTRVGESHQYSTRGSSTDFIPIRFKTLMGKNSFKYSAATQWNMLPTYLKLSESLCTFKKSLKKWLQSQ